MSLKYQDFFLTVNGSQGKYTVEARGPGQISVPPLPFDYHETEELRVELNRIKEGFAPKRDRMEMVGTLLFNTLFPRKIIRAFGKAMDALEEGERMRLKLVVRPPDLSHLPWELLYDPDDEFFMAARLTSPIVRFIESGTPVASLLAKDPVRVLYLQANPPGTEKIDTGASERALRDALGKNAEITVVRNTTPAILQDQLREPFHILHYDGHGIFDEENDSGHLYLHDEQGKIYHLTGEMLATYLDGSTVRLVVLAACETAVDSKEKRFSGIAHQLMRASSLPAVVAMQYEIPDSSAIAFATGFYGALADDHPVDAATIEGRKAILGALGKDPFAAPDWATPVLFMRVQDGDILREDIKKEASMSDETKREVNTGGGAYIGGDVSVGGDFVGRDQISHHEVHGDQITVGDVSGGTGIAIGRGAQATVTQTQGLSGDEIAKLFQSVYQKIEARPEDPDVDKEEVTETVKKIEAEAAKGEEANPNKVERWLKTLGTMAPDILEVTAACLVNPVTGIAAVIRKVAEKAKKEAEADAASA
ncbi:MAG: CHAT domain-containing protein [Anaerolineae bacterium]